MGKLDEYKKNNPTAFQSQKNTGERKPVINLLIKISGYEIGGSMETNYVLGKRIDTGEEVKVRLFDIQQKENSKYKRVEVEIFANMRTAKKVVEGNFMVFEQAREESEGVFSARWAIPLDRDPNNTSAFVMLASLRHGVKENDHGRSEWFQIKTLFNKAPIIVTSEDELDAALTKLLSPKYPGSNPQAIVRITDDAGEKMAIDILPLREEVEENGSKFKRVVSDPARSIQNFKDTQSDKYNLISQLIGDDDVKIEVIGSSSLYPGSATQEKLEGMPERSKEHLVNSFLIKKEQEATDEGGEPQNNGYPEVGYHFCVIGTRMFPDGTPYLTYIKPLLEYTAAVSINDIESFSLKK